MVGRGAVVRPWIFAEARALEAMKAKSPPPAAQAKISAGSPRPFPESSFPAADLAETGLRFLELLARYQPPEFHLSRARRFFAYFCGNLTWGTYLKNLLNREEDLGGIERVWRRYFAGAGAEGGPLP
jgi:tRNA-dihydrouridine synthase